MVYGIRGAGSYEFHLTDTLSLSGFALDPYLSIRPEGVWPLYTVVNARRLSIFFKTSFRGNSYIFVERE